MYILPVFFLAIRDTVYYRVRGFGMTCKITLSVLILCAVSASGPRDLNYPSITSSDTSINTIDDILYYSRPINQQEVRPVENTSASFSNPKTVMKGNLNEYSVETSNKGVISISPHSGLEVADIPDNY